MRGPNFNSTNFRGIGFYQAFRSWLQVCNVGNALSFFCAGHVSTRTFLKRVTISPLTPLGIPGSYLKVAGGAHPEKSRRVWVELYCDLCFVYCLEILCSVCCVHTDVREWLNAGAD